MKMGANFSKRSEGAGSNNRAIERKGENRGEEIAPSIQFLHHTCLWDFKDEQ